jgi:predicted DCC family thiol-disulfide oxidoreductase YuxK
MFNKDVAPSPASLTVLYDPRCGFCAAARRWMEGQAAYLPVRFVRAQGAEAARLYPELVRPENADELFVVTDQGRVYRGGSAWILCLWALEEYREWSYRLSSPALLPLARRAFELVSKRRRSLSRRLGLRPESELLETLQSIPDPACSRPPLNAFERRPS